MEDNCLFLARQLSAIEEQACNTFAGKLRAFATPLLMAMTHQAALSWRELRPPEQLLWVEYHWCWGPTVSKGPEQPGGHPSPSGRPGPWVFGGYCSVAAGQRCSRCGSGVSGHDPGDEDLRSP